MDYRSPISEADLEALRSRNAARLAETKQQMGRLHLLHPANRIKHKARQKRVRRQGVES